MHLSSCRPTHPTTYSPQVIKGGDNPLAKAAACGKPTAHLHAAAEHDLNCLQQLAVADRTLATWVKDTAFGATDAWLEAASCLTPPQQFAPQPVHKALMAAEAPPPVLAAPLSEAQRAGLREKLAGAWRWGEGVEVRPSLAVACNRALLGCRLLQDCIRSTAILPVC